MRLVLTGFMATGKTRVGRRIAERLERPFIDTDAAIEAAAGKTVPEIFATEGEARFRERERSAVREAAGVRDAVISVGGGALLSSENRAVLERFGFLVCLTASPEEIAARVGASAADRPLLAGAASLPERIRELLAERAAVYARVTEQVDTSGRSIEEVADEVIRRLRGAERGA
jgi:shikimate kinase